MQCNAIGTLHHYPVFSMLSWNESIFIIILVFVLFQHCGLNELKRGRETTFPLSHCLVFSWGFGFQNVSIVILAIEVDEWMDGLFVCWLVIKEWYIVSLFPPFVCIVVAPKTSTNPCTYEWDTYKMKNFRMTETRKTIMNGCVNCAKRRKGKQSTNRRL